ncbi:MAG: tyrosine-type recombinase/integrase [Oscillospiraceae bacterium]|nr:tyrosine-type recombinase/integrase [Oscillospiraceae bacterium]
MICQKCRKTSTLDAPYCPYCGKKLSLFPRKARPKTRGNGTGTAFKRGNSWTAQVVMKYEDLPPFDPDNPENSKPRKKITRSKGGFKTRDAALQYCPILKNGLEKSKQAPTLEHYWKTFQNGHYESVGMSKKYAYDIAWRRLESIQNTHIDQLTVADLQKVVADKCSTYNTARDVKTLLMALFRTAAAEGYVNKDLPTFIQLPKQEETERIPFSETEQAAIWKLYESGDMRAAPILLMIYTGMMPVEAMALTVDKIDLEHRQIVGAGAKTKVRKATPIVLAESIVPVVEDLIAHANPDGTLWKGGCKPWYNRYYKALEAAGVRRLSPYSCRHTTATALAITEGVAPQTVRKVMRWANTKMLDRYAHPDQSDALAAVNTINSSR